MDKEISNRGFIVLRYKTPYKLWAEQCNVSEDSDLVTHLKHQRIYMIDFVDPDDEEELDEIIKENYPCIFERELASWNNIKREWPMSRSFEMFKEWFDITVTDVGYDLSNEQLAYEKE